jgi:hypothetical protein
MCLGTSTDCRAFPRFRRQTEVEAAGWLRAILAHLARLGNRRRL